MIEGEVEPVKHGENNDKGTHKSEVHETEKADLHEVFNLELHICILQIDIRSKIFDS